MRKRFVLFDEYYNLIANADCLLALTNEDDSLQAGAFEALAVETPMVISDTNALLKYFLSSAVYSSHIPPEIKSNILYAVENNEYFRNEIRKI
ncbi:MAG: hypothetical protein WBH40_03970 [Ignavibacteriaceae bacterium]|jgi:hypothetical protein